MLDDLKLMLIGRDKGHNNLRGFEIEDPGLIEQAKTFLHAHPPSEAFAGNLEGRPAKLAVGDLEKYLPPVDAHQGAPTVTTASSRGSPRQGGGPRGALGYRSKTQDDETPIPEQFVET